MPVPGTPPVPVRPFTIVNQRIGFDVNFASKTLKGWTEITINPLDPNLKQIKLNCRQCTLKRVAINGKGPNSKYTEPYSRFNLHKQATVNQHHMLRSKMATVLRDPPEEELIITIPKSVKIDQLDPFSTVVISNRHLSQSGRDSPDIQGGVLTPAPTIKADPNAGYSYTQLIVSIDFTIDDIRDGFHFVGCDPDDPRYPHAYTTNSPIPGSACCLFPCIDDIHERYTWDIEVTVPRTLGDIRRVIPESALTNGAYGVNGVHRDDLPLDDDDEANDMDMIVVCSGDFTDEVINTADPSKKIVKFTQSTPVAPQHISFAVGPFEKANLSDFREVEEDDAMGAIAVEVTAYSLPGREYDVKNTCMFMHKAVDFIVRDFGTYPYASYKLCFVDDLPTSTVEAASLSLCSNHLLFPDDVIDPIYVTTRKLTYTLAAQWVGVNISPKEWQDMWVIIGIGYYITGLFLKKLVGNNEYRFRLKKDAQKICELDINRPSLYAQGIQIPLEPSELEFMILKAPVVLFILERRLTKATGSLVLHRTLRRIILHSTTNELPQNALSTQYFIRMCEKLSHSKLDTFFSQWVFGSGYPRFAVSQRFNKKKLVIEMGIKQVQATDNPTRKLSPDEFMMEARLHQQGTAVGPIVPVYSGPMTIRIHEADGTPYEHVVNITEGYTKLDIPYNTKYKRLKRTRRQKERAAVAAGLDISMDAQQDDVLLYCLGDVLQSEEEIADWRIEEWSKEEEEKMAQESFEWIRMDADFEWICMVNLSQPDYMFLSQLQQDRDVVAQYEAIEYFSNNRESALVSSILVRTLMDRRYYYGIRTEAAMALAKCARAELDWIGEFHLRKAFQEFYCLSGSSLPRGNDFSDYTAYFVQKSIPMAMARIRNNFGSTPLTVQKFLLDLLRYNDNSNNPTSDCHYVSTLMTALAQTLIVEQEGEANYEFEDQDIEDAKLTALREIERHQRMDQFLPSYQNIISETALEIKRTLVNGQALKPNLQEFLAYAREGNFDQLRLKAFDCLIDLGGIENQVLTPYTLFVIGSDQSPYIRRMLLKLFSRGLGALAINGSKPRNPEPEVRSLNEMIVEEEIEGSTNARKAEIARESISGAIAALKKELKDNTKLKEALWNTICSPELGVLELRELLDICRILYDEKTSLIVTLKQPKHLTCKHLGKGVLHFKWDVRKVNKPSPIPATKPITSSVAMKPLQSSSSASSIPATVPSVTLKFKNPALAAAAAAAAAAATSPSTPHHNKHSSPPISFSSSTPPLSTPTPSNKKDQASRKPRQSAAEKKRELAAALAQLQQEELLASSPNPTHTLGAAVSTPKPVINLKTKTKTPKPGQGAASSAASSPAPMMTPTPTTVPKIKLKFGKAAAEAVRAQQQAQGKGRNGG